MRNDKVTQAVPESNADPFYGEGGSYVINAATQTRELVARTAVAAVHPGPPDSDSPAPDPDPIE